MRMAEAELIFSVSTIHEKIMEIDKKIDAELMTCTKVLSEFETVSAAKKISSLICERKELIKRLQIAEKKKLAVARLIWIKDNITIISARKSDIFRNLDLDEITAKRDEIEIKTEIEEMKLDKILDESGASSGEYKKILEIVKSVILDDESVKIAKVEIECLSLK